MLQYSFFFIVVLCGRFGAVASKIRPTDGCPTILPFQVMSNQRERIVQFFRVFFFAFHICK